jgi:hypothetical protein
VGRFTDYFWEDSQKIFGKIYMPFLGSPRAATAVPSALKPHRRPPPLPAAGSTRPEPPLSRQRRTRPRPGPRLPAPGKSPADLGRRCGQTPWIPDGL